MTRQLLLAFGAGLSCIASIGLALHHSDAASVMPDVLTYRVGVDEFPTSISGTKWFLRSAFSLTAGIAIWNVSLAFMQAVATTSAKRAVFVFAGSTALLSTAVAAFCLVGVRSELLEIATSTASPSAERVAASGVSAISNLRITTLGLLVASVVLLVGSLVKANGQSQSVVSNRVLQYVYAAANVVVLLLAALSVGGGTGAANRLAAALNGTMPKPSVLATESLSLLSANIMAMGCVACVSALVIGGALVSFCKKAQN